MNDYTDLELIGQWAELLIEIVCMAKEAVEHDDILHAATAVGVAIQAVDQQFVQTAFGTREEAARIHDLGESHVERDDCEICARIETSGPKFEKAVMTAALRRLFG
jgi:hypothetical protein